MKIMKKFIALIAVALMACNMMAEEAAEMTFKEKTHNFGVVAQDTCVVTCTFTFTNTGNAPLVIHQAISSCGCTVPEYTMEPIAPGQTGTINVTYNGKTKRPGVWKKSITIHSNAKNTPVRIYIEGELIPSADIEELLNDTSNVSTIVSKEVETSKKIIVEEAPKKNILKKK